jgi:hypothetical protein
LEARARQLWFFSCRLSAQQEDLGNALCRQFHQQSKAKVSFGPKPFKYCLLSVTHCVYVLIAVSFTHHSKFTKGLFPQPQKSSLLLIAAYCYQQFNFIQDDAALSNIIC